VEEAASLSLPEKRVFVIATKGKNQYHSSANQTLSDYKTKRSI
jgi:hypothetical protein